MVYLETHGGVAQLGEHLNGIQGVRGSIPLLSIRARTPGEQSVVLFASVPLTKAEDWKPLGEGELVAVRRGRIVARD